MFETHVELEAVIDLWLTKNLCRKTGKLHHSKGEEKLFLADMLSLLSHSNQFAAVAIS